MRIKFKRRQRKRIRAFLSAFHGKEHVDLYKVFTAIAYLVYTGCQWKMLPTYYPRPTTVYYHFRKWSESTDLVLFLKKLLEEGRRRKGRKAQPSVAVIDSQSIRSAFSQSEKGVDGFKKIKGIKRQLLVDAEGFPMLVDITTANVHDSKGVDMLLRDMRLYYPTVSLVKTDQGYRGVDAGLDNCIVECVKSNFGTKEIRPIAGRWVVERTNAWLENFRCLCRNHERYISSARAMTYLASVIFMLRHV